LPEGKVWWIQPNWVNGAGQSHWASANVWKPASDPVERKPATLALRFPAGVNRKLLLTSNATMKISDSDDDDDAPAVMRNRVVFHESGGSTQTGTTLRLQYKEVTRDFIEEKRVQPSRLLPLVQGDLPRLLTVLQLDARGNVTANQFDPTSLNQLLAGYPLRARNAKLQQLNEFHEPIKASLESLSVPLPGAEVKPLETWKATRPLPIDQGSRFENGLLDITYTYLGQRKRNGKDEAVIAIEGAVRGAPGKEAQFGGKASGTVLVDLATGMVTQAETRVSLELEVSLSKLGGPGGQTIRLLTTQVSRLERGL
jgi:hypothetical protein